mmetsp:Transcript_16998/g.21732  ORF Transcript_16998/g.21732 Transcript_16998/m.21732 type:complete len:532 (+) Transcript_16998:252-1847(+)
MGDVNLGVSAEEREQLQKQLDVEKNINPFTYEPNFTPYEALKLVLGIVTVPVKFSLFIFCLFNIWIWGKIMTMGSGFNANEPLPLWRRMLFFPCFLFNRLLLLVMGVVWIEKTGKVARTIDAPIVVCAPHSTVLDIFVSLAIVGRYSGFGKQEVTKTPFFGTFAKAAQTILVNRESKQGKEESLNELIRRIEEKDPRWPKFLVFPEGTCTNRKRLIQFKRGSFVPGVPVQLITFQWPHVFFDPTWTSSTNRKWQILRLMTQFIVRVKVHCHKVYVPNENEKKDPFLFASNVRQAAADYLGVGVTEHSYEDTFLSQAARKAKFNPNDIVDFEFASLKDMFEITLKDAKRLLKRFGADYTVKKTGKMNAAQFARALGVPLTDPIEEIFDLMDKDHSGLIDFKSFLIGLTFISQKASSSDGVEILFQALDPDGTGKIDAKSLHQVMTSVFGKVSKEQAKALIKSADPDNSGFVTKESFLKFIEKNPELLVAGLKIRSAYVERWPAPLSVHGPNTRSSKVEETMVGTPNPTCEEV